MEVLEAAAVAELHVVLLEEVHQRDAVVGRFSFAVGGDTEDDECVLGDLVERLKVVAARGGRCQKRIGSAATPPRSLWNRRKAQFKSVNA